MYCVIAFIKGAGIVVYLKQNVFAKIYLDRWTMIKFLKAYIKTMRLYYAFLTGIAGWIGVSFYEFTTSNHGYEVQVLPSPAKKTVILVFLFFVWGINQVINDYLGLEEDKINAPLRPMVTGELNAGAALLTSFLLIAFVGVVTYFYLEPAALIPMLLGIALNVVYEYAKGYGVWGNIIFGIMISCCTVYGFMASGGYQPPLATTPRLAVVVLVAVLNAVMTYFTYFKDYIGDKKTGKNTIVVKYGLRKARVIGIIFSLIPAGVFLGFWVAGAFGVVFTPYFCLLAVLAFGMQLYTAFLYYRHPVGDKTYYSLKTNFRACICSQAALIALFNPPLGMALFLVSYIFVGFLFDLTGGVKV